MLDTDSAIQKQYENFKCIFNKENFPAVFEVIDEHNEVLSGSQHRYGRYAILYTPVRYQPKIMIVGNNPSWFDKDSDYKAEQIVKRLMDSPPAESSYLTDNHVFAHRLNDAFNRIGRHDLLREAVGMNRLWLQTGPSQTGWTRALKSHSYRLGISLTDYCERETQNIIREISPKVLLLVGAKAQQLPLSGLEETEIKVEEVSYPLGGGITALTRELRNIVGRYDL